MLHKEDSLGLFDRLFKRKGNEMLNTYFKSLSAYNPIYTTYKGGLYEMERTRSAIHCFARACSKLKIEITGSAKSNLKGALDTKPNPYMDSTKFLYRLATILSVNNNAFIIPLEDDFGNLTGFFPVLPSRCEVVEYEEKLYMRYAFSNGKVGAIEFEKVGILNQFQYYDDFFGEDNGVLNPTMQLININNQGIVNGVKSASNIRFLAKVGNIFNDKEIEKERERFSKDNLSSDNATGLIVYDNKFADLKQIDSKPFIINSAQMAQIDKNVYCYFGTNEKVLQNSWNDDEWNAYYEGAIEPFAIQLSNVLTNMTFTERERACGNKITLTSNRMQYASNSTKLAVSQQMFDRGLFSTNMIMDIWNLPHVENGDKFYIRKEYAEISELNKEVK